MYPFYVTEEYKALNEATNQAALFDYYRCHYLLKTLKAIRSELSVLKEIQTVNSMIQYYQTFLMYLLSGNKYAIGYITNARLRNDFRHLYLLGILSEQKYNELCF